MAAMRQINGIARKAAPALFCLGMAAFTCILSSAAAGDGSAFSGISKKWTIAIAKIDHVKSATAPNQVMQRGTVYLHIQTTLFGTPLKSIGLPFSYVKRSLWNTKDRDLRSRLPSIFEETIWPEIDTLEGDELIVVINPEGVDPTTLETHPGPVAVRVQKISGKDDPAVSKLLKEAGIKGK